MDAQRFNLEASQRPRALVVRVVVAWLVFLLAVGLWQGYGVWLLSRGGGDAF